MKRFVLPLTSMSFILWVVASGQPGCTAGSDNQGGTGGSAGTGGRGGTGGGTAGTGGGMAGTGGRAPDARRPDTGGRTPDAGGRTPDAAGRRDTGASGPDVGGSSADTWETYAKGFFATYCASCHNDDNAGDAANNFRMLANVVRDKAKIACGVSKSMADWTARGCTGSPRAALFPIPPGVKPSDAERDRLIRWIDSGTP
jgi:hypothetical protein